MKKAAKEKKEETEYNYVNTYAEMMAPRMQKGAMAYDGPNKAASEAKDRVMQKTKEKQAKMKEENVLLDSGIFTEEEIAKFLWVEFDEGYQRNPEKDPEYNKDNETFAQRRKRRMNDPKTGINSPAFKKFMASQGM